jgi:xylulokinase
LRRNLLAVDCGSSALKAVLFGGEGSIRAAVSRPLVTNAGSNRSQEQDPEDWWTALKEAIAALPAGEEVSALVFTGSMQNLIALRPDGRAAAPAVLYSDRRLEEEEIVALAVRLPQDYAARTGNRLDPAHTILKLMRLEAFLPAGARAEDLRWAFGAKDALTLRLTGRLAIDPTTASTTGLMDIASSAWDRELVALAGVEPECLPEILPGKHWGSPPQFC